MRRKHSKVTDPKEIERILSLTNMGRLATSGQDGYPYITPLNFVSLEGSIYSNAINPVTGRLSLLWDMISNKKRNETRQKALTTPDIV
jgi:hypothetical protein